MKLKKILKEFHMLGVVGTPATNKMNPRNEETLKEEYVESMDSIKIANALGDIKELWDAWKGGNLTTASDVRPAQKELKKWINRWFKQNIN